MIGGGRHTGTRAVPVPVGGANTQLVMQDRAAPGMHMPGPPMRTQISIPLQGL